MDELQILINDIDLIEQPENDEAFASVSLNPTVAWAKFVLTDDMPNANRQRVPLEEFDNLIKTGTLMPIKMAKGGISDGHELAEPIGVIANLKKSKNQILGLAALWQRERPEDVELIRNRYKSKEPLQLSWEILYQDASEDADGVKELRNTALRATTLVGMPAYEGRTPILEVASLKNTKLEETDLETLEEFKTKVTELETELTGKTEALAARDAELVSLKEMLTELESLRQFKTEVETRQAEEAKLSAIKKQFADANLSKEDNYFEENKGMLLGLGEDAVNFLIQELVAFSSKVADASKELKNPKVPPIDSSTSGDPTPKDLAQYLRSRNK